MLIGSRVAWYCSYVRNTYHENLRTSDCGPQHNGPSSRSPYEQPRRSRRDEASLPLRVYNVPPSYAEITQSNDQTATQPQATTVNANPASVPVNVAETIKVPTAPKRRRTSRRNNEPLISSDGERMIYC
jgi:hypothetical protein